MTRYGSIGSDAAADNRARVASYGDFYDQNLGKMPRQTRNAPHEYQPEGDAHTRAHPRGRVGENRALHSQPSVVAHGPLKSWNSLLPMKEYLMPAACENGRSPSPQSVGPDDSISVVGSRSPVRKDVVSVRIFEVDDSEPEMMTQSSNDWQQNLSRRFATMDGFSSYVLDWRRGLPKTVQQPCFQEKGEWEHWKCTLDPVSGKLLDPVPFPGTRRDNSALPDDKARLRRRTGTANSARKKYTIIHGEWKDDESDQVAEDIGQKHASTAGVSTQKDHLVVAVTRGDQDSKPANADAHASDLPNLSQTLAVATFASASPTHSTSFVPGPMHPQVQAVPYYIRPAEKTDMEGVREIYNLEVLKGTQATDAEPLGIDDFHAIFEQSRKAMLPFLAVVAGHGKAEGEPETVLGFGFLSVFQPGLAGGLSGTSRYSVKANVFVHANHRQQGVGSTILSRLLQLCSFNYQPKKEYGAEYVQSDETGIYNSSRDSPRQYHHVFAEVLCGNERGLAEMWYERVLSTYFGFQSMGRSSMGTHWSNVGQCWLSKLVFQHDCYAESAQTDNKAISAVDEAAQAARATQDQGATTELAQHAGHADHVDHAEHAEHTEYTETVEKFHEGGVQGSQPNRSIGMSEPTSFQQNSGAMLVVEKDSGPPPAFW